jgi:N,N'-diacetylchitobiose phosphorylase
MQYGYFDDLNREYVITRPDTPAPWANYLGSPAYGAILSNNAGGYSFVKSGANGRILRYRFNADDKPGRYVYLRDRRAGTTGRFPGSRLQSLFRSSTASAATARDIL